MRERVGDVASGSPSLSVSAWNQSVRVVTLFSEASTWTSQKSCHESWMCPANWANTCYKDGCGLGTSDCLAPEELTSSYFSYFSYFSGSYRQFLSILQSPTTTDATGKATYPTPLRYMRPRSDWSVFYSAIAHATKAPRRERYIQCFTATAACACAATYLSCFHDELASV